MPADETQHQLCFAFQHRFRLTERSSTKEHILYFGFSIGFSCHADEYKVSAQQQAVHVVCHQ
jgi:hypothetical protein